MSSSSMARSREGSELPFMGVEGWTSASAERAEAAERKEVLIEMVSEPYW